MCINRVAREQGRFQPLLSGLAACHFLYLCYCPVRTSGGEWTPGPRSWSSGKALSPSPSSEKVAAAFEHVVVTSFWSLCVECFSHGRGLSFVKGVSDTVLLT